MTAPAAASITIEERLATVEATLAAFTAEERVWRNQFVEDQREYRREINAPFNAFAGSLSEHRRATKFSADVRSYEWQERRREADARHHDAMAEARKLDQQFYDRLDRIDRKLYEVYLLLLFTTGIVIVLGVAFIIAVLAT